MTICPIRSRNFHFGWLQPCSLASAESRCRRRRLGAPAKSTAKAKPAAIKVTGCLQKGDSADEFAITGENGKTWELRSRTVKLADHVGHTVTITGVRHHETKAEEAKEEKTEAKESKEAEAKEAGDLRVTSLNMVSESCKK